jgi:acetyl esterase/lipase
MPDEPTNQAYEDREDRSILTRSARVPDATWAYGADPAQVMDAYLPGDARSGQDAVLLVHGGFWRPEYDRTHLRPMAAALADLGFAALLIEYRRVPGDPDATTSDVRAAVAAAPALLTDAVAGRPGALLAVGHSAGGHLVLWLAAQPAPGVAGCLALAPVADLRLAERLGLDDGAVPDFLGCPAADRPDLDPARLPPPAVPVVIVHGVRDSIVPISLSLSYGRSATRLLELPSCAHFELIDPGSGAWPAVIGEVAAAAAAAEGETRPPTGIRVLNGSRDDGHA